MSGFFYGATNVDARSSYFNSVTGNQSNQYIGGSPYPTRQINRRSGPQSPSSGPDDDDPSWMPGHPDPPSFAPGHHDPPSFTPGYPNPPSWSSQSTDPPSWVKRSGIPAQSTFSTETSTWPIPDKSTNTESTARANRPPQQRAASSSFGSMSTPSSLTSTNAYSSFPSPPMSIIHTANLPNSNISPDEALTNFKTDISPWKNPVEYIDAEADHVNTIVQEMRMLTGKVEMEQASFIGQPMIYSRLIAYIFAHLMLCTKDKRLLEQFTQSLKEWKTWDNITKVQNYQLIKDYLQGLHQKLGTSRSRLAAHPESTFRKLLTLDTITLSAHLAVIVTNDIKYKELLGRRGEEAQSLLNLLQARLDVSIGSEHKPRYVKALIRLSKASGCVPECLVLKGIAVDGDPVAGGGFGDVYKGRFRGQEIALKVLKVYQKSDMQKLLKDFSCEAVTWRQLNHPNVLPFYGVYHLDKNPPRVCLASPWLDNGNVVQYLAERAPNANCVPLSLDVAQGLEYLHDERIIHGDMKGLNILISRSGRACLADFGLASARDSKPIVMTYMTTNKTTGTLRWQAPELFPDMQSLEPEITERHNTMASDVYAYGLVCHEMFSNQYPFPEISIDFQVMFAVKQGKRPTRPKHELSRIRGLNDEIWHIIEACWNQDPGKRPSASEVVEYLRGLPNRPDDHRPLNDFDKALPSQVLSLHNRADHPFSTLTLSPEDTDKMHELKWISRDVGA